MNITLKKFQEDAIEKLVSETMRLLAREGTGELIVFQSPTGSGKTVMTAKFIENLIKELPEEDLCLVWISIGKGELHLQSKRSLERIFDGFPLVTLADEEFGGARNCIEKNEVVVVNWEKMRTKDREGEWKNRIMKDGEFVNFREVIANTKENRKVIMVIDESHASAATVRANEIREVINAEVVVEMSATPRFMPTAIEREIGNVGVVYVKPSDVIEQGMIKKELLINERIGEICDSEIDSEIVVLEAAFQKRNEIAQAFSELGVDINPLVLVQLPNVEEGEAKLLRTVQFLAGKGIEEDNGKLSIWLSERKSDNLDTISDMNGQAEFLVFKQAIDTGWDCPRAHILVKFRESHSEIFEIQTVGRILRMPEQKHYSNEDLNRGYLYTNIQSIIVKKEEFNPNIIKHLKAKLIPEYTPINLQSYYKSRSDYGDVTASFVPVLELVFNSHFGIEKGCFDILQNCRKVAHDGVELDVERLSREIIADTTKDYKAIDDLEGAITPDSTVDLKVSADDITAEFERSIKSCLGSFTGTKRSVPIVKGAIYAWFKKYLGSREWVNEIQRIQRVFTQEHNWLVFEPLLFDALEVYKSIKEEQVKQKVAESERWDPFELKHEFHFNGEMHDRVAVEKYAYEPCYLPKDLSGPEKQFIEFLSKDTDKIKWWWKNGENSKDYFGIRYEFRNEVRTFYPDFLVYFESGRIGIFETKDAGDRDGLTDTKAKAEAMHDWIRSLNRSDLFGGIVIQHNRRWYINSQSSYDWEKTLHGDWSDWVELVF